MQGPVPQTQGMAVSIPAAQQGHPWGMQHSTWGFGDNWDMGSLWVSRPPLGDALTGGLGPMEGAGRMAHGGGLVNASQQPAGTSSHPGYHEMHGKPDSPFTLPREEVRPRCLPSSCGTSRCQGLEGYPTTAAGRGRGHYMPGSQSTPGKRPMLEVNHNKAITKKLAAAVHYQQVGHESAWLLSLPSISCVQGRLHGTVVKGLVRGDFKQTLECCAGVRLCGRLCTLL